MEISEVISQLENLANHCSSMRDKDDPEDIWTVDVEALEIAASKLKEEVTGENAADIVRNVLSREKLNQKELAEKMGSVRQNVSQMLTRTSKGMRCDSFEKMIETLGYEIVVRKKKKISEKTQI